MPGMTKLPDQYEAIRSVIEEIVERKLAAPSLPELADSLGVSPGHLQKVFTDWAGISPKQFARYLSLQYAKGLLAENRNMLEATFQSGLSGPGRLHDLFVDIEAMTPGEYQNGGENLVISYSTFPTRFGLCLAASTERGVTNVLFADSEKEAVADLTARWPNAKLRPEKNQFHRDIEAYFEGLTPASKIKLCLHGTNFQLKVWEALLSVPEGHATTYGDIAEKLGGKNFSRLVGTAVGNNPVGYLIPCHRVLKSSGEIGGYHWGLIRKRAMLGFEALRREQDN